MASKSKKLRADKTNQTVQANNHRPFQIEHLEDRTVPVANTFDMATGVLTLDLNQTNEIVTVNNNSGNLAITSNQAVTGGASFTGVNEIVVVDNGTAELGQSVSFIGSKFSLSGGLSASGVETVQINAVVTATGSSSIAITAPQSILVNQDLTAGSGGISLTASGAAALDTDGVTVQNGAVVSASGAVTVTGTGGSGNGSDNYGVLVTGNNSKISTDTGALTIIGNSGLGLFNNRGVVLQSQGEVSTTTGNLTITGTSRANENAGNQDTFNHGVEVNNAKINAGGNSIVQISGNGGTNTGRFNHGVLLIDNAEINHTGTGPVTVAGNGGGSSSNGGDNYGIELNNSKIKVNSGALTLRGNGGGGSGSSGNNRAILLQSYALARSNGQVTIESNFNSPGNSAFGHAFQVINSKVRGGTGISVTAIGNQSSFAVELLDNGVLLTDNDAPITLTVDSVNIGGSPVGRINAGSGTVTIQNRTAGTKIDLGGNDVLDSTLGQTLGLTDAELDQITAGKLIIGKSDAGTITFSNDIRLADSSNVQLLTAGDIVFSNGSFSTNGGTLLLDAGTNPATIQPTKAGFDVVASTTKLAGDLKLNIAGPTLDTQYDQLKATGAVDLNGVALKLAGTFAPAFEDSFTIVSTTTGVTGTFDGLVDGTLISFNNRLLEIDYTANTVTLTDVTGSLQAKLDGSGNLTVTDVSNAGRNNDLKIQIVGTDLVISDANEKFDAAPMGWTLAVDGKSIRTAAAFAGSITLDTALGNDSLNVVLTGNNDAVPTGQIFFNGGAAGNDSLKITGGAQGTVTYNYTNVNDGNVVMSNFGTVNYTGLEPIANTGTANDVIFNLPNSNNTNVVLQDNSTDTIGVLKLTGSTFENTVFNVPTNSITINGGSANDTITVNKLDGAPLNADLIIDGKAGTNTVNLGSSGNTVNLGAGDLTVTATNVNFNNATTVGGTATVTASGSVTANNTTSDLNVTGDVSITAGTKITFMAGASLLSVTGDVSITAGTKITFEAGASLLSGGAAELKMSGNTTFTGASVQVTDNLTITSQGAGSSLIRFDNTPVTVTTGDIQLTANNDVEIINNSIVTATAGDIKLIGNDDVEIETNAKLIAGTDVNIKAFSLLEIVNNVTITATGAIAIDAQDLDAGATDSSKIDTSTLTAGTDLSLAIGKSINLISSILTATTGDVTLTADTLAGSNGFDIVMSGTSQVVSTAGDVTLLTDGDIQLTKITAAGLADLKATNGNIADNNGATTNITATSAVLVAGGGVGTATDALETAVDNLEGSAGNGFFLANTGSLTIGGIGSTVGNIVVTTIGAGSDLTVNESITTQGNGTVQLVASNDLTVNNDATVSGTTITATAVGDLTVKADADLTATNGAISLDAGVGVTVDSSTLQATDDILIDFGQLDGVATLDIDGILTAGTSMDDQILINGGAGANTFNLGGTYTAGSGVVVANGLDGADDFVVLPQTGVTFDIDGGSPGFGTTPADTIQLDPSFTDPYTLKITGPGIGFYTFSGGKQKIEFENIELADGEVAFAFYGDFNGTSGKTQTDFFGIAAGRVYGKNGNDTDFGWVDTAADAYDGAANTLDRGDAFFTTKGDTDFADLLRDGAWGRTNRTTDASGNLSFPWLNNPYVFRADLPVGEYFVTVTMGDTFARDFLQVIADASAAADGSRTAAGRRAVIGNGATLPNGMTSTGSEVGNIAGEWGQYTFVITVAENTGLSINGYGSLFLEFATTGGDKYWVVNALTIVPVASSGNVNFDEAIVDEDSASVANSDGLQQVTVNGTVGGYSGLLTVGTEFAKVNTAQDADRYFKGVQVNVEVGAFSFDLTVPTTERQERFTAIGPFGDVSGMDTKLLSYVLQDRRFDFNRVTAQSVSPTADNFLGVSTAAYDAALGYGYSNPFTTNSVTAIGFDRGTAGGDKLTRDGHFGQSGGSTFDIQVTTGDSYDVTIDYGDSFAVRTGMEVKFEGGDWMLLDGLTSSNRFGSRTFANLTDTNDDGRLSMTFRVNPAVPNTGYWTVNGLQIVAAGGSIVT